MSHLGHYDDSEDGMCAVEGRSIIGRVSQMSRLKVFKVQSVVISKYINIGL